MHAFISATLKYQHVIINFQLHEYMHFNQVFVVLQIYHGVWWLQ